MAAVGYGEFQPVADNATDEGGRVTAAWYWWSRVISMCGAVSVASVAPMPNRMTPCGALARNLHRRRQARYPMRVPPIIRRLRHEPAITSR